MADSDKTLQILIQLGVLGKEDAAAVNDLLKQTKQDIGDMNQSMPENLAAWEKFKDRLKGAGEGAEGIHEHIHNLRALMAGAGPEAAELGHLLHFAFNPVMLGGAALAAGMEAYFHWVEKAQERQREMTLDLQKHNDFLREAIKLTGNFYENQFKIAQAIAEARAQQNSLTEELKAFEDQAKVYDQAQNDDLANRIELRKGENTLLEDQIQLLENIGKLTPAQAEQDKLRLQHQERLAEIGDKVVKAKSDYESAKSNEDEELKKVGGRGAFTPDAIGAANEAAAKADVALKQAQMYAGQAGNDEINRLKEAQKKNMDEWEKHGEEWDPATGQLKGVAYRNANQEYINQIKQTQQLKEDAEKNLPALTATNAIAQQHLKDIQGLHDKFQGMDAALELLKQKWVTLAGEAPAQVQQENQRAALESINAMLKGGAKPGDIFKQGIDAMFTLDHLQQNTGFTAADFLQRGTPAQKAWIQHLQAQAAAVSDLETAIGNNGNTVLGNINSLIKTVNSSTQAHAETAKWAATIEAKIAGIVAQIASLQSVGIH